MARPAAEALGAEERGARTRLCGERVAIVLEDPAIIGRVEGQERADVCGQGPGHVRQADWNGIIGEGGSEGGCAVRIRAQGREQAGNAIRHSELHWMTPQQWHQHLLLERAVLQGQPAGPRRVGGVGEAGRAEAMQLAGDAPRSPQPVRERPCRHVAGGTGVGAGPREAHIGEERSTELDLCLGHRIVDGHRRWRHSGWQVPGVVGPCVAEALTRGGPGQQRDRGQVRRVVRLGGPWCPE